ncbi:MAG TPA: Tellurite resistance protein TerB, partial [Cyanobacteria bacterium UBA11049]|nr:Tellurite resistance protein TerB [Cyanobacteria bacterium UBA11049]
KEYLGDRPSAENCHNLIEAISGLIYSDGEVAIEEAKFLSKLQSLNSSSSSAQSAYAVVVKEIQKLYRKWVESHN